MKDIISQKIKQGRVLNAMSQQELAGLINVSKQMLSKYEAGKSIPSSSVFILLAKALKVKMDYFFTPSLVELGEVNFRKKSSFSKRKEEALKENIKIKLSNYLEIENILQISNSFHNSLKKEKIQSLECIEPFVARLRKEWEIGLDPIHNIIQILEDKEIKIIEIDEAESQFDGLAATISDRYSVIVINKNFSVERKRFTLLHELGHLLLDCNKKDEELLCNRFASEFLLPKSMAEKEFGVSRSRISLKELIEVQKKYGISIRAIIYRLKDIGIFEEYRVANFYKRLNFDSSFKREVDMERFQTPEFSNRFEQLVYRAYAQELISSSKAASLLGVSMENVLENASI